MSLQSPHLTLSIYDYDIVLTIFVVFFAWELPTLITSIVTKCSCFQKSFSNVQIYIININIGILLLHVLPVKRLLLMTYYYNSTNLILLLYMYILICTTIICPACTYSLYSQVSIITTIQNHCHICTSLIIKFCLSKSNKLIVMDNGVYHKLTSIFLLFLAEPRPRNNYYFSSTIITQLISHFIKYRYGLIFSQKYHFWFNHLTQTTPSSRPLGGRAVIWLYRLMCAHPSLKR